MTSSLNEELVPRFSYTWYGKLVFDLEVLMKTFLVKQSFVLGERFAIKDDGNRLSGRGFKIPKPFTIYDANGWTCRSRSIRNLDLATSFWDSFRMARVSSFVRSWPWRDKYGLIIWSSYRGQYLGFEFQIVDSRDQWLRKSGKNSSILPPLIAWQFLEDAYADQSFPMCRDWLCGNAGK